MQEALKQEVIGHLGRGHYQRRRNEEPLCAYRSDYEPKRVKTSDGRLEVKGTSAERDLGTLSLQDSSVHTEKEHPFGAFTSRDVCSGASDSRY